MEREIRSSPASNILEHYFKKTT